MAVIQRSQEELRESQRTFATLLSNLPGLAYRCRNDRDWTMEFVSEGCYLLTGYHPEDLVNSSKISYAQLIHPDDQQNGLEPGTGRVAGEPAVSAHIPDYNRRQQP